MPVLWKAWGVSGIAKPSGVGAHTADRFLRKPPPSRTDFAEWADATRGGRAGVSPRAARPLIVCCTRTRVSLLAQRSTIRPSLKRSSHIPPDRQPLPRRWPLKKGAAIGPGRAPAREHPIPLGELVRDGECNVGEGGAPDGDERLRVLPAAAGGLLHPVVVSEVGGEDGMNRRQSLLDPDRAVGTAGEALFSSVDVDMVNHRGSGEPRQRPGPGSRRS